MITIYGLDTLNGTYVGCTAGKVGKRMREHSCLLRAGRHTAQALQRDWLLDSSSFKMRVLEVLPDTATTIEKRECELKWMRCYETVGELLNDYQISFQPPNGAPRLAALKRVANGYTPSRESNLKRSLAQKGKPKGHGAKISATKQANKLLMR